MKHLQLSLGTGFSKEKIGVYEKAATFFLLTHSFPLCLLSRFSTDFRLQLISILTHLFLDLLLPKPFAKFIPASCHHPQNYSEFIFYQLSDALGALHNYLNKPRFVILVQCLCSLVSLFRTTSLHGQPNSSFSSCFIRVLLLLTFRIPRVLSLLTHHSVLK